MCAAHRSACVSGDGGIELEVIEMGLLLVLCVFFGAWGLLVHRGRRWLLPCGTARSWSREVHHCRVVHQCLPCGDLTLLASVLFFVVLVAAWLWGRRWLLLTCGTARSWSREVHHCRVVHLCLPCGDLTLLASVLFYFMAYFTLAGILVLVGLKLLRSCGSCRAVRLSEHFFVGAARRGPASTSRFVLQLILVVLWHGGAAALVFMLLVGMTVVVGRFYLLRELVQSSIYIFVLLDGMSSCRFYLLLGLVCKFFFVSLIGMSLFGRCLSLCVYICSLVRTTHHRGWSPDFRLLGRRRAPRYGPPPGEESGLSALRVAAVGEDLTDVLASFSLRSVVLARFFVPLMLAVIFIYIFVLLLGMSSCRFHLLSELVCKFTDVMSSIGMSVLGRFCLLLKFAHFMSLIGMSVLGRFCLLLKVESRATRRVNWESFLENLGVSRHPGLASPGGPPWGPGLRAPGPGPGPALGPVSRSLSDTAVGATSSSSSLRAWLRPCSSCLSSAAWCISLASILLYLIDARSADGVAATSCSGTS